MGASASSNVNTIKNNIITNAYANCPATNVNNNQTDISYVEPKWCPAGVDSGFSKTNIAEIDSQCFLGSLQNSVATTAETLNPEQKTQLGFSQDINSIENQIRKTTQQTCQKESSTNNINIETCPNKIIKGANDNTVCQLKETQKIGNKVASVLTSSKNTTNIWNTILIIIVALIVIGIIAGLIAMLYKNKNDTDAQIKNSTNAPNIKNNKAFLILIIIIILLLIAVAFNMTKTKTPLSEQDIEHLKQTIDDAKEIAKIEYSAPPTPLSASSPSNDEVVGNDVFYTIEYDDNAFEFESSQLDDFYKPLLQN